VTEGEKIVAQAIAAYGTVHVLINNAGILREFQLICLNNKNPNSH
jgi:short-subunit dehydrogenase involved in D-alanine esterification of teichoic acids